jgi:O-Antigen ligase
MNGAFVRGKLPRLASAALVRSGIAAKTAAPIVFWSVVAVTLGLVVGIASVILPPTGAFGIAGIAMLVLLWSLPDLPSVPDKLVRRFMFVALVVDICVPDYYAITLAGLPWISVRRIFTGVLIIVFGITISGSSSARKRMASVIRGNIFISICSILFLTMAFISIFSSVNLATSTSGVINAFLAWYIPFFVVIYVVRTETDALTLASLLCWSAAVVAFFGAIDFMQQKYFFITIMPSALLNSLLANSPIFSRMLSDVFRNGQFRAASAFNTPLSFGEFEAMIVSLGYFFLVQGPKVRDRLFGFFVVLACWIGIYCAGSRGGYQAALLSTGSFAAFWSLRTGIFRPRSLAPTLFVILILVGAVSLIGILTVSTRIHNMVLGGGEEQYSTEARWDQWDLAKPIIARNPITGYGFSMGADVVHYHVNDSGGGTLDSYVITTLVETGVPGFLSFAGLTIGAALLGLWLCIHDPSASGALAGALGSGLVGFAGYRLALSQIENHTLFFVMVGMIMVINSGAIFERSFGKLSRGEP